MDTGSISRSLSLAIANVETYEFRYPLLYLFRRQEPDTGGPGRYRGGVSVGMMYTPHDVDVIPTYIMHVTGLPPAEHRRPGRGYPASTNQMTLARDSRVGELLARGIVPQELAEVGGAVEPQPGISETALRRGDVYHCVMSGGGGYLDPLERDPGRRWATTWPWGSSRRRAPPSSTAWSWTPPARWTPPRPRRGGPPCAPRGSPAADDPPTPPAARRRPPERRTASRRRTATRRQTARRRPGAHAAVEDQGATNGQEASNGQGAANGPAAAAERVQRVSEVLAIARRGDALVLQCRCGHALGPATENYKLGAVLAELPLQAAGPHVNPVGHSPGRFVFRHYYCPGLRDAAGDRGRAGRAARRSGTCSSPCPPWPCAEPPCPT